MPHVVAPTAAPSLLAAARRELDRKTKPLGALGRLETIAAELAAACGTLTPVLDRARVIVFGADHGVAQDGVSAYPREVTGEMMRNFARGGAAINVVARSADIAVEVVDVGVDADLDALGDAIVHARVRAGTRNLRTERAMTDAERDAAVHVGRAAARRAHADGIALLGLGEMGIGNTTAAAALLAALTGRPAAETVGRGTGVDDARLAHKTRVVDEALARHGLAGRTDVDAWAALAAVGGLELAAIAGAVLEASARGMPVVIDGFIVTVAALAAVRREPDARRALFFAHRSAERGHALALAALDAEPILDLGLRLGEGSGAALAIPVLRAAAAVLRDMATFESAGVSAREADA